MRSALCTDKYENRTYDTDDNTRMKPRECAGYHYGENAHEFASSNVVGSYETINRRRIWALK